MADSQLLVILAVAMVAGVILFRLFTVLGRRTGNEREPPQPFQRAGGTVQSGEAADNKVVPLPGAIVRGASAPANPTDPLASALAEIKVADRAFEAEHFVTGASHAYELILTAFAANDRTALRPLLSDEVYAAFDAVIKCREERKEKVAFTFVGVKDARISHAILKGRTAEVTVTFAAQYISATSSENGAVVDGDPKSVRDAHDIWTFARDVRSNDPNWTLVATTYGEA
jgi:predicted lipid-binding transport protein (Tim44 family)